MTRNTPELDRTIEHLNEVLDDVGEHMKRAKNVGDLADATKRYVTTNKVARLAVLIESLRMPDADGGYAAGYNDCLDACLRVLQSEMPR